MNVLHVQAEDVVFKDVKSSDYFYEAIKDLAGRKILSGYKDGTFRPYSEVTRAQAARMVANILGINTHSVKDPGFADVPKGYWAHGYVAALVEKGILSGYDDNTFKPNEKLNRAQMAKIIALSFGLESTNIDQFKDVSSSDWFSGYVGALVKTGITKGKTATIFDPNGTATRAQFAAMIYRSEQGIKDRFEEEPQSIETITNSTVKIGGVTYNIADSLKSIFTQENQPILKNAKVLFESADGIIQKITYLEIKTNGSTKQSLEFDGKKSAIDGNVKVSADNIFIKNLTVKGNLDIGKELQNNFYSNNLVVEGKTVISNQEAQHITTASSNSAFYKSLAYKVSASALQMAATSTTKTKAVFEASTLGVVEIDKDDVDFEFKGKTTIKELTISSKTSIKAGKDSVLSNVLIEGNDKVDLNSEGSIGRLEIKDKNAVVSLGSKTKVIDLILPENTKPKEVITNYDHVNENIEKVDGQNNPDNKTTSSGGGSSSRGGGSSTLNPPSLAIDNTDATVGHDIELTFTANTTWQGIISSVEVDGVSAAGKYTVTDGKITLDKSMFATAKNYTITVKAAGYTNAIITQAVGTESDQTGPIILEAYPDVTEDTGSSIKLLLGTDEASTAYYVILPKGQTAPTKDQIIEGKDHNNQAVTLSGSSALTANTGKSIGILGLEPTSSYNIYVVAVDGSGNQSIKHNYVLNRNSQTAPQAPQGLAGIAPTAADITDGKITGLDPTKKYQYKLATAQTWEDIADGSTEINGLAAGIYQVRIAASGNTPASEAVSVIVAAYQTSPDSGHIPDEITTVGTYGPEAGNQTIQGNLVVKSPDVTLRNLVIEGDLIIDESVGDGDVHLNGVEVRGTTKVNGGGAESIHFKDSVLVTVIVNKNDGKIRIVAEGKTTVADLQLESYVKVEESGLTGDAPGFTNVTLSEGIQNVDSDLQVNLEGTFETINSRAANVRINLAQETSIERLVVSAIARITGAGIINTAQINANNVVLSQHPSNLVIEIPNGTVQVGDEIIEDSYSDSDATALDSIAAGQGMIDLNFEDFVAGITMADFEVTATLEGQPVTLQDFSYNPNERKVFYRPIDLESNIGKSLTVTVAPKGGKVTGEAKSSTITIGTGFQGRITDIHGVGVPGLTIRFRQGQAQEGEATTQVTTDKYGYYSVNLPAGSYTGEIAGEGFISSFLYAVAPSGSFNTKQNETAIRAAASNELKIMLSWGEQPSDVDSHLFGPTQNLNERFHTSFDNRTYKVGDIIYADLDWDDTDSYGPETTTIRQLRDGKYTFIVHNWSESPALRTSNAKVEIFKGNSKVANETFLVPQGDGNELYWKVFNLIVSNNGEEINIEPINSMHDVQPEEFFDQSREEISQELQNRINDTILLLENAQVGTLPGNYRAEDKESLMSVLDEVSAVLYNEQSTPDELFGALNRLVEAVTDFTSSQLADSGKLVQLILQVQALYDEAQEGDNIGEYATGSKATLRGSIDRAKEIADGGTLRGKELEEALNDLEKAQYEFESGKMVSVIQYSLSQEIHYAQNLYDTAQVGTEIGQYPAEEKEALGRAIDAARSILDKGTVRQREVEEGLYKLGEAIGRFKDSEIIDESIPGYIRNFQSIIEMAEQRLDDTEEGTEPGQYPAEAREQLRGLLTEARQFLAQGDVSEEEVHHQVQILNDALLEYEQSRFAESQHPGGGTGGGGYLDDAIKEALYHISEAVDLELPELDILKTTLEEGEALKADSSATTEEEAAAADRLFEAIENYLTADEVDFTEATVELPVGLAEKYQTDEWPPNLTIAWYNGEDGAEYNGDLVIKDQYFKDGTLTITWDANTDFQDGAGMLKLIDNNGTYPDRDDDIVELALKFTTQTSEGKTVVTFEI